MFAYKRPEHLRRTLTALLNCEAVEQTPITVFIDGPQSPRDTAAVAATRGVAEQLLGSTATIEVAETNRGLARSITSGVSRLVEEHGRIIVLEDDLEVSRGFLSYMNMALDLYAENDNVFQISGHMFDVPEFRSRTRALFLPFTTTWGWATWARAWRLYDPSAEGWQTLLADRRQRLLFDLNGAYPYAAMLYRQMRAGTDSWGIRWYWAVFKAGGLCVFPPRSLVRNWGYDGTGTHGSGVVAEFDAGDDWEPPLIVEPPLSIKVDAADLATISAAIWRLNGGWKGAAVAAIQDVVSRLRR